MLSPTTLASFAPVTCKSRDAAYPSLDDKDFNHNPACRREACHFEASYHQRRPAGDRGVTVQLRRTTHSHSHSRQRRRGFIVCCLQIKDLRADRRRKLSRLSSRQTSPQLRRSTCRTAHGPRHSHSRARHGKARMRAATPPWTGEHAILRASSYAPSVVGALHGSPGLLPLKSQLVPLSAGLKGSPLARCTGIR